MEELIRELEKRSNWGLFHKIVGQAHRILLYGPPGTGKTTTAVRSANRAVSVTLHEDMSAQELLGFFVPKGSEFVWKDGLATSAFRTGATLVLNEVDKASPSVFTILLNLLDDKEIAVLDLPTGEKVRPHADYKVIGTMNGRPNDLPTPLLDRFDVKIYIPTPHPDAIQKIHNQKVRRMVINSYLERDGSEFTFRQALSVERLLSACVDPKDAFELVGVPYLIEAYEVL